MIKVTLKEYLANREKYQGYKMFRTIYCGRVEITAVYPNYDYFCGKENGGYGRTFAGHSGTVLELEPNGA